MKKVLQAVSLFLAAAFVLGGCKGSGPVKAPEAGSTDSHGDGIIYGYDLDNEGNLYYLTLQDTGEVEVYPALKEGDDDIVYYINESILHIVDIDGKETEKYVFDERSLGQTLEYGSGCIYFALMGYVGSKETALVKKYTLGDSSAQQLCTLDDLQSITKTALINDTLYILGIDPSNAGKNENTNDRYTNSGEKILAYNIADNTVSVVFDSGAVEMSDTPNNTLMIYAHDEEGYYFTEYDPAKGFGQKQYYDLGKLFGFAVCGENRFVYSNTNTNASIASFDDLGKADLMLEEPIMGEIKCSSGGKMCYIGSEKSDNDPVLHASTLKATDISEFLKADLSSPLTMISAEYIADAPPSLGYSMNQEQVDYDSFALTVLSQDPKNDLYLLYSRSGFAENIKSKGSFYPLNEVEGVREYIDSCFPGLSAAAVDDEGAIWMLPVSISVPALAYSDKLSGSISDLTTEELVSLIINMYNDKEKADSLGQFDAYFLSELMLSNYLFGSTDLDTEEFRNIAKMLKDNVFSSKAFSEISKGALDAMTTGDYSDIDLTLAYNSYEHYLLANSGLSVTDLPMPTSNAVPSTCAFICVNPTSKNLEQTLNYISALAKSLLEDHENLLRENSPQFEQGEYFKELKEVYKKAEIRFSYSGEIILNDLYSYLEGKIALDDFISEANRKLSVYLNE